MGKVRVLTEDLVSLISAGEVIENPASVIKELVENSLDAEADMIDVLIEDGGIKTISVSDNGSGILKDDCKICLHRHSTSKIAARSDLDEIGTYGFRGEALASIAAVADILITTQTSSESTGMQIVSRAGSQVVFTEISRPHGTTVKVENLFQKIPARRKHLADAKIESQRIQEVIMRYAAIRPEIGFRLVRDGEVLIDCPPKQTATDRIAMLWGSEIAGSLVDVDFTQDQTHIIGFMARPPVSRGNRSREYFSIRKRPISDEKLGQAVESAFSTTLMKGQFPIFALDISLDVLKIDVNVHPTKREVRILEIEKVCEILVRAIRYSLGESESIRDITTLEESIGTSLDSTRVDGFAAEHIESDSMAIDPMQAVPLVEQIILKPLTQEAQDSAEIAFLGGVFRIVGQIHNMYILLEFDDGLLIIDQHAAHERVLYERLRKQVNEGNAAVQELLQPFILNLSQKDAEQIMDMADVLEKIGYTIRSFGGNDISVSTLPEVFGRVASEQELISLADRITDTGRHQARENFLDELVKLTACHSAIRAGQPLDFEEIRDLLLDLSKTTGKYNCCHGRPSMIKILKEDIDRSVGRLGPDAVARFRARHHMN
jgi:DNA mismatch repair protein MutL